MPNPNSLIMLPDDETAVQIFNSCFSNNNNVYLLILGNSDQHNLVKEKALPRAVLMRHVMQINDASWIMDEIEGMPKSANFHGFENVLAISLSQQGVISFGLKEPVTKTEILFAFLFAETNHTL